MKGAGSPSFHARVIDSPFGEAAVKGIKGFDMAAAYEGLKKHATQPGNPDAGYGRRGIEEYLKFNYDPADKVEQSAAETVDAAYGDFCIAQVAKATWERSPVICPVSGSSGVVGGWR